MSLETVFQYGKKEVILAIGELLSITSKAGGISNIYREIRAVNNPPALTLEANLKNQSLVLGPYTAETKIIIIANNAIVDYSVGDNPLENVPEIPMSGSPSEDLSSSGIIYYKSVTSNTVGIGCLLYVTSSYTLEEANATDSTKMPVVAMALEAGEGIKKVLYLGTYRDDSLTLDERLPIYANAVDGTMTQDAATDLDDTGNIVQIVGTPISETEFIFHPNSATGKVA